MRIPIINIFVYIAIRLINSRHINNTRTRLFGLLGLVVFWRYRFWIKSIFERKTFFPDSESCTYPENIKTESWNNNAICICNTIACACIRRQEWSWSGKPISHFLPFCWYNRMAKYLTE